MWYNDKKETIIRAVMKHIDCVCYDDHFGVIDMMESYEYVCEGKTYTINITDVTDITISRGGNLTTEVHDVGSIPYESIPYGDDAKSISGIMNSTINYLMNGTKESRSWNKINELSYSLLQNDFNGRRRFDLIITNEEDHIHYDCVTIQLFIYDDETFRVCILLYCYVDWTYVDWTCLHYYLRVQMKNRKYL